MLAYLRCFCKLDPLVVIHLSLFFFFLSCHRLPQSASTRSIRQLERPVQALVHLYNRLAQRLVKYTPKNWQRFGSLFAVADGLCGFDTSLYFKLRFNYILTVTETKQFSQTNKSLVQVGQISWQTISQNSNSNACRSGFCQFLFL